MHRQLRVCLDELSQPWVRPQLNRFRVTTLGRMLMDSHDTVTARMMEEDYCIVGDEAYAAGELMAVPWPGGVPEDRWKDIFHIYQFSCHVHVEQAFGLLVSRWGAF